MIGRYSLYSVEFFSKAVLSICIFFGSRLTNRRLKKGRLRSIWGVTPILTLPILARCDRMLGISSESLVYTTYYVTNKFDINLTRIQNWIINKAPEYYVSFCYIVLSFALLRYDIFHLYCDRGLLAPTRRMEINPIELDTYSRAKKFLFTYAYGADVRTRDATLALGEFNLCKDCPAPGLYCQCSTVEGELNTVTIKKYATRMIAMGDMLNYIPEPYNLDYWPLDLNSFENVGVQWEMGKSLKIAHVPNHSHFKGSQYLEKAVQRLVDEGWRVEILTAKGVTNNKVIEIYSSADLVADQFIAGFHGYAALEAMALGKPVLCYIRNLDAMIGGQECPIISVNPNEIYGTLLKILNGKIDLNILSQKSRRYVEEYSSLKAVSQRLASLYLDSIPLNPKMKKYFQHLNSNTEYL
jgi:glycosyltransferase involved in cell wall biosynthesis